MAINHNTGVHSQIMLERGCAGRCRYHPIRTRARILFGPIWIALGGAIVHAREKFRSYENLHIFRRLVYGHQGALSELPLKPPIQHFHNNP